MKIEMMDERAVNMIMSLQVPTDSWNRMYQTVRIIIALDHSVKSLSIFESRVLQHSVQSHLFINHHYCIPTRLKRRLEAFGVSEDEIIIEDV